MIFEELDERNSTIVEVEGKELRTIQDPYVSDNGSHYIAKALDVEGNTYIINWAVIDPDTTDESSACDWDNPVGVTLVK